MQAAAAVPVLMSDTASLAAPSSSARSQRTTDDHDAMSLTTSNPFEEEQDYSSYQIVSRLMNKVKEAFVPSLGSGSPAMPSSPAQASLPSGSSTMTNLADPRLHVRSPSARPTALTSMPPPPNPPRVTSPPLSNPSRAKSPTPSTRAAFPIMQANPLPPLVSLTPVTSSVETTNVSATNVPGRILTHGHPHPRTIGSPPSTTSLYPIEATMHSIPGFPLADDARTVASVATNGAGLRRTESVSKVIRRIRGEGLSKTYWMEDEHCKECYDCKSVFTTWRRKHHCRICGQIFCSRCASNLIKASRFNAEGTVRVCNLCMRMLEEENAHSDDDDRRSISSLTPSLPTFHNHSVLDVPYLASIAERAGRERRLSDNSRQPITPPEGAEYAVDEIGLIGRMDGDGYYAGWEGWEREGEPVAPPFRRGFDDADEDKDPDLDRYMSTSIISPSPRLAQPDGSPNISHVPSSADASTPPPSAASLAIPIPDGSSPRQATGKSSVTFPTIGSAEGISFPGSPPWSGGDSPRMGSMGRMMTLSTASLVDAELMYNWPRSGMRSRVQSRLQDIEAGWRTRRESSAYAAELNAVSMQHLRTLLRQELRRAGVLDVAEWESTLVNLGLKLSITPFGNPRAGDSIDARDWVKIKRIPGGAPRDSECIDGVMITKNVAHKNMARAMKAPRVMLVTFPFEYQRVEGQFTPLEPLLAQEREYLANLVSRVAALRPHIVLVEKSVSRIALELLLARNIAVGRTVKASAVAAVSRATQADIISSIDRLALEPHLGHAGRFRVQTFEHELIPGRRKSYMRFEGCHREHGVTLAIRGGDIDVLTKIKAITKFMVFTVRNLKMETFLWRDLLLSMPQLPPEASLLPVASDSHPRDGGDTTPQPEKPNADDDDQNDTPPDPLEALSVRIREVADKYRTTFLSVSATLRFPAPYPVRHMLELDEKLRALKREWERDEAKQILVSERNDLMHRIESTATSPNEGSIDLPKTPTPGDVATLRNIDEQLGYFDPLPPPLSAVTASSFMSEKTVSSFVKAATADQPVRIKQPSEIALQSSVEAARVDIEEYRKMWSWYVQRNADDFRIEQYQKITFMKSLVPVTTMDLCKSCGPPLLENHHFYGKDDLTLGQYIERSVNLMNDHCPEKHCDKPMKNHSTVYVHNDSRVVITVEQMNDRETWKGPAAAILEHPDRMITWSVCQSCHLSTPFIPLTDESWRYSFSKYLELFFYPAEVVPLSGIACFHNVYKHHVRYFWWRHVAVRCQLMPVTLSEAVFPPVHTRIRPETLVELKNSDYESILHRQSAFWDSVVRRIHTISASELQCQGQEKLEKMAKLASLTPELLVRAEADRHELLALTRKVYDNSAMTDTLAFSEVRTALQAKVLLWDQKFAEYEHIFIATERDIIRRATASQLRRLFANQELATDRLTHPSVAEVDEKVSIVPLDLVSPVPSDITETLPSYASESETASIISADPLPTASDGDFSSSSRNSLDTPTPTDAQSSFATNDTTPTAQTMTITEGEQPCSPTTTEEHADHDSDSTIEAPTNTVRHGNSAGIVPSGSGAEGSSAGKDPAQFISRLPRRAKMNPGFADLVKRFQEAQETIPPDSAPPSAFQKPVEDGDTSDALRGRSADLRNKLRRKHRAKTSKPKKRDSGFGSDFERSYAANVGPRYLESGATSRIPAPARPIFMRQSSSTFKAASNAGNLGLGSRPPPSKGKMPLRPHERSLSNKPSMSSLNAFRAGARRVTGPISSKVSTLTKKYERLAIDADKAARRVSNLRYRRARPLATTQAKIQVFDNVKDAIRDESDSESSESEADDEDDGEEETAPGAPDVVAVAGIPVIQTETASPERKQVVGPPMPLAVGHEPPSPSPMVIDLPVPLILESPAPSEASSPTLSAVASSIAPSVSSHISEVDLVSSAEKHPSLLKSIAAMGLWPGSRPGDWPPLDYPSSSLDHIFADSPIVIREDEPTSIISFALSTKDYKEQIKLAQRAKIPVSFEAYVPEQAHHMPDHDTSWGMINPEDLIPNVEDVLKQQTAIHSNQIFESGGTTIFCRVFFAEQFDALRRSCGCETSFVESLARCLKWDAAGGKSGSAFLKTRDDRFIAKELSRPELAAMTKFAPKYFEYMSNAFSMKRPSVLAKVFGFYKIGYKNPNTGRAMRLNLLVMENVFYERRFSKIYDLKGSMRNRLIHSTGKVNEVLLDENLVQSAHLTPWYIREHTKCMLRAALWNDTNFLCDLNVMDYSLLVGVDSERNELVVGIVDYIRTYTWDKKLESWVKESTFLGGAKGEPTIVTPRQYKTRFLSAMERYLMMVPDRWMKRPDQPDPSHEDLEAKQDAS